MQGTKEQKDRILLEYADCKTLLWWRQYTPEDRQSFDRWFWGTREGWEATQEAREYVENWEPDFPYNPHFGIGTPPQEQQGSESQDFRLEKYMSPPSTPPRLRSRPDSPLTAPSVAHIELSLPTAISATELVSTSASGIAGCGSEVPGRCRGSNRVSDTNLPSSTSSEQKRSADRPRRAKQSERVLASSRVTRSIKSNADILLELDGQAKPRRIDNSVRRRSDRRKEKGNMGDSLKVIDKTSGIRKAPRRRKTIAR